MRSTASASGTAFQKGAGALYPQSRRMVLSSARSRRDVFVYCSSKASPQPRTVTSNVIPLLSQSRRESSSEPAMPRVGESTILEKHVRALAGDHVNAPLPAELHGGPADGARATGPIHPDRIHTGFLAFMHHRVGTPGRCHDQNGLRPRVDIANRGVAFPAFHFLRSWVYGD